MKYRSLHDLLVDALRDGTEVEGFHVMLEASLIEGDQFLLYMRNLPDKVAESVQLPHELDVKVHATTGGGQGGSADAESVVTSCQLVP